MKKDPLFKKKHEMNDILRAHDVEGMRKFMHEQRKYFEGVSEEQIVDDQYIYDLLHIYKAHLFYLGQDYRESMKYCLEHKLISLSSELMDIYDKAKGIHGSGIEEDTNDHFEFDDEDCELS